MPPRKRADALGTLEAAVLEALWQNAMSTPAVYDAVGRPRGLAYTTILTVLQRLLKKGLVVRSGGGRSHIYAPAMSRERYAELRGESLASTFVEIGTSGVAAFLAEAERLDPALVSVLRRRLQAPP